MDDTIGPFLRVEGDVPRGGGRSFFHGDVLFSMGSVPLHGDVLFSTGTFFFPWGVVSLSTVNVPVSAHGECPSPR